MRSATGPQTHRVIATAGHVDHGKSTLVRALTGMEPDRLTEEQRRGLTIELGFAWTTLGASDNLTIAFVDVPGHERFISTMLAGAGPAPSVMFVVAADDGWSAQSSDHLAALDLLQVRGAAIAVTKSSLVDAARLNSVIADVTERVAGTSLARTPTVAVDAVAGTGLDQLRNILADHLVATQLPENDRAARLWVDRCFSLPGSGTVVTGTLGGGEVKLADAVAIMPARLTSRVRSLHMLGTSVPAASAGQRVAINLAGVNPVDVQRGDLITTAHELATSTVFDAWLRPVRVALAGNAASPELKTPFDAALRSALHLHIGTLHTPCRVLAIGTGEDGLAARIVTEQPVPTVVGERFVLRDVGRRELVAGGVVADPLPKRRPRGEHRVDYATGIARIADATTDEWWLRLTALAGGKRRRKDLDAATGFDPDPVPNGLIVVGDWIVTESQLTSWQQQVTRLGPGTHARERLQGVLPGAPPEIVDTFVSSGLLTRVAGGVTLAKHAAAESDAMQQRIDTLLAILNDEPLAPPDLNETARQAGVDHRLLTRLIQQGHVVRCGSVAFTREAVDHAVEVVRALGSQGRPFTAAEAKSAWGTTRKFAIPLLEHLDRIGVTTFDGQHRTLR